MARIDTIIDDLGKDMEIVNVENSVGTNSVNDPHDVKIVKALFQYVPYWNPSYTKHYSKGFQKTNWQIPAKGLPSPNDSTIWGVEETITSFQKYANKMLSNYGFKVSVNGRIKPAKTHAAVGGKYSTVVALNVFANLTHFGESDINNVVDFFRRHFDVD